MIFVVGTRRDYELWLRDRPELRRSREVRHISTARGAGRGLRITSDDVVEFVGIVPDRVRHDIEIARLAG